MKKTNTKVLIIGSNGFIGKNISLYLGLKKNIDVIESKRKKGPLIPKNCSPDFIINLAGVNRPKANKGFQDNYQIVKTLNNEIKNLYKKPIVVLASSTQANLKNPYGVSKLKAETIFIDGARKLNYTPYILRLPNVFGKWCKPNYNSVVATFCYNLLQNKPLQVNYREEPLTLLYIDDLCLQIYQLIKKLPNETYPHIKKIYKISLDRLAKILKSFKDNEEFNLQPASGTGIKRKLYATFISYKDQHNVTEDLVVNKDNRGDFVEVFKTNNHGQVSYFTSKPGITRGMHFHNTKVEKFLIISGKARFDFQRKYDGKSFSVTVSEKDNKLIYSIPGWTHSVTNIGKMELRAILWSSEVFNPSKPDTFFSEII